ncbi:hypothetical protein SAMN02745244_01465 [Tessaracoccus bendigoensis DSM 12906]|uniref:DUF4203 domain-containing protein n=1 Tax=Tessaracoccus bendigoensis DSM 12906 TaxID=1123357 RepID=A0A1M6FL47_9ACTN|nr:hypothetical protein [Tessaracoccus bendigoensis]SHI98352.1 hypothetical protein SAMN02745244_01465 [Tessaracoccus bendigoensis DSM 12906]
MHIFWGILAIVAGLVFCFRGYLAMRTVIGIWGAFVGFSLGAGLAAALSGEQILSGVLGWISAFVGALLIGGLAYAFYAAAVILAVGSVGFGLGTALAGLFDAPGWLQLTFALLGAAVLITVAIVTNMPEILLVLVAAAGGASAIIMGVLMVTGMIPPSGATSDELALVLGENWWLNVAYFVLLVAGILTQLSRRSTANLRAAYGESARLNRRGG